MTIINSIKSELLKTKYPPIFWLVTFTVLTTMLIIFSAHYIDIHGAIKLGSNPWIKINNAGKAIFSSFMAAPFVVMFISAFIFIERQNHGFKQLYTLPKRRAVLILYKLSALLILILMSLFILAIGNLFIAFILNFLFPEMELTYYAIPLFEIIKSYFKILISLLGIIGLQFFLSFFFTGFLVPASLGILSYIIGLILASTNNGMALFFPYSLPIIGDDGGIFSTSGLVVKKFGVINQVEITSIIFFILSIGLCLIHQKNKNI